MKNEFELAFNEISELRSLPRDVVLEALQTALISAYRRDANASAAQRVEATIDPETGRARIFVEKEVVEDVESLTTEVSLEKARYYEPEANLGDTVMVQVEGTTKKFGRIAAQTAKQVILQKIREAERNALYDEFVEKEGDIVNGLVQSVNSAMVTLSLGRAEAALPRAQQIPGERYKPHDKVRCYVLEVKRTSRGPQIVVSRSHRNMLRRLLEFEVPEIYNGQIEIKNIAREAGYRSKVAVYALQEGIDPVGACVGMRGVRIQNIVKELHDEKIDVIEWSSNHEVFIQKALSPARVTGVYLDDDPDGGRTAIVIVPDDQLSLAIGREGQNARLAAKLTGWRIDIKSVSEAVANALENLDQPPLTDLLMTHTDVLEQVGTIIEKKNAGRAIMPEEYKVLDRFADTVERRLQGQRDAARQARIAEVNAIKATLPEFTFEISVQKLDLPDAMIEALEPLGSVGEIMLRFLIDENRLRRMLGKTNPNALRQLQDALDKVVMAEDIAIFLTDDDDDDVMEDTAPVRVEAPAPVPAPVEPPAVIEPEPAVMAEPEPTVEGVVEEPVAGLEAFPDEPVLEQPKPVAAPPRRQPQPAPVVEEQDEEQGELVAEALFEEFDEDEDEEDGVGSADKTGAAKKKDKKERQKRRQLVFDEERGQTVAKRRRKGGRKRDDWGDEF
ncbi:MAG: hypothetical protein OHK0046_34710 [Anaerolineae bacterium]